MLGQGGTFDTSWKSFFNHTFSYCTILYYTIIYNDCTYRGDRDVMDVRLGGQVLIHQPMTKVSTHKHVHISVVSTLKYIHITVETMNLHTLEQTYSNKHEYNTLFLYTSWHTRKTTNPRTHTHTHTDIQTHTR